MVWILNGCGYQNNLIIDISNFINCTMSMLHGWDNAAVKSSRLMQQSQTCNGRFCGWAWVWGAGVMEILLQGHAFPWEFRRISFFCVPAGISSSGFSEYTWVSPFVGMGRKYLMMINLMKLHSFPSLLSLLSACSGHSRTCLHMMINRLLL